MQYKTYVSVFVTMGFLAYAGYTSAEEQILYPIVSQIKQSA